MMTDDIKLNILKYIIDNCLFALDELKRNNEKMSLELYGLVENENTNYLGSIDRMVKDYLIIRVYSLFDDTRKVNSLKKRFKNDNDFISIEKEDIIVYIKDIRHNFSAHINEDDFINKIPSTHKIINSNLKDILMRLKIKIENSRL